MSPDSLKGRPPGAQLGPKSSSREPNRNINAVLYTNGRKLFKECAPFLYQSESLNNLPIYQLERLKDKSNISGEIWALAIREGRDTIGFCFYAKPHYLVLSDMTERACGCLALFIVQRKLIFPGVMGPVGLAECFAEMYCSNSIVAPTLEHAHLVYEARTLSPVAKIATGRFAQPEDLLVLLDWAWAFAVECGLTTQGTREDLEENIRLKVKNKKLYVLVHNSRLVSMAALNRESTNGYSIGLVFTPPEFRGHGYASQVVHELTAWALRSGKFFCNLFTDVANPTSNKIYQDVGYKLLGAFNKYRFAIK